MENLRLFFFFFLATVLIYISTLPSLNLPFFYVLALYPQSSFYHFSPAFYFAITSALPFFHFLFYLAFILLLTFLIIAHIPLFYLAHLFYCLNDYYYSLPLFFFLPALTLQFGLV